ncbi:hypothetical protein Sden_3245 [Shewanella denitrificans OS217]|uniref:Uncharacterized protein n=1 Tax=Shewanella denitrificans (strain OS217 / ATCC BAA-1090 / DSM 15013) TaxID=318161 RepID=Q12J55_SHEDO|nr:hypothetical protein [Shewanella denitrificans]ABE56521.1 hypothetical protein Sden_3245 [Shewanella denitrificans OS217]
MIQAILDRLALVDGTTVREGFYVQSIAKEERFIFLQPYTDGFDAKNGIDKYKDELALQVVAGVKLTKNSTPTADLINLVRAIRCAFYKDERFTEKPSWLPSVISFKESEPCKYIMPEAHESHGLAVLTLSLVTTVKFGDSL